MASDLDRARALKAQFERAASAQTQNVERLQGQKAMADRDKNTPGRTTSASKVSDPDDLSRARSIKEQFQRAAAGQDKEINKAADKQRQEQARSPRHQPAPGMHHQPRNPAQRDPANRVKFESERGALAYDKLGEALRKQRDVQQAQQRQADRDKGDDRSK